MPMNAEGEEAYTMAHRGTAATLTVLRPFCVWNSIETDVGSFVKQCLHCIDGKAGILKPHPLGAVVHGKEVGEVLNFDFLHIDRGAIGRGRH